MIWLFCFLVAEFDHYKPGLLLRIIKTGYLWPEEMVAIVDIK